MTSEAKAEKSHQSTSQSTEGGPILIVDDDPDIREELAAILELEGYAVEIEANGNAALRAIERTRPSLVILDMHMPFLDGREFIAALREQGLELPVILITGDAQARHLAQEIGASGYLAKPFDLADLLETVRHHYAAARPWWRRFWHG